jgi:hypothetical protein
MSIKSGPLRNPKQLRQKPTLERPFSRVKQSQKGALARFHDEDGADLTMHRKPTWLVEVSTGSGWRAAGR